MFRTLATLTVGALLVGSSQATPLRFQHSGRLLDAQGEPVNTDVDLTVSLAYSQGGTTKWSQSFPNTPVQNG